MDIRTSYDKSIYDSIRLTKPLIICFNYTDQTLNSSCIFCLEQLEHDELLSNVFKCYQCFCVLFFFQALKVSAAFSRINRARWEACRMGK